MNVLNLFESFDFQRVVQILEEKFVAGLVVLLWYFWLWKSVSSFHLVFTSRRTRPNDQIRGSMRLNFWQGYFQDFNSIGFVI